MIVRCLAILAIVAAIIYAIYRIHKFSMQYDGNDVLPPSAYQQLPTNRK